jgi:putative heme-binding domain-containing protein
MALPPPWFRSLGLAILALLAVIAPQQKPSQALPAFRFEKGDRVCLLGSALAERMQHDGWFETLLRERLPDLDLSIRNLAYSGDELTVHQRVEGCPTWDDDLMRCRATVVLAFFGTNESFAGEAGLPKFRADLGAFLDAMSKARYDGEHAPRVVLCGPIPNEDLKDPLLPDGHENNVRLALYDRALAEVARERSVPFVELFTPMQHAYAEAKQRLTVNGLHLNEAGDRVLAKILVGALVAGNVVPGDTPHELSPTKREELRAAVLQKDLYWFNRYQTTDGYNVYGGRSSLAYTDGVTNFTVLQRELGILDALCIDRDRRIAALANGRDEKVDDSAVPPKIAVKTNIPGPNADGSFQFTDAEAAIKLMTPAKGMKIELFADEQRFPELAKPVQMAFDTKGRLWVAAWPTYPHWEPQTPMRDKLLILEDTDGDGRADKCTTFAGDLRNPTGFEFWNGGVLLAQAPELWFMKDSDGDGVADVRERLLQGLSTADSHHTANSFVLGPDGALYWQEGTFHQSQIETIYGPERNHDACVWRFEPRTFRVERHIAYDFANPHGHVFDRWGQEFVTDGTGNVNYYALPFSGRVIFPQKHSPYFPFFEQRSRPCAGSEILSSRAFPPETQGDLLLCNVIGFQGIFRYRFEDAGSGFGAKEVEPLVYSSDPSFRPVAAQIGPDGAVYFLDWYNPIIGHMQHHLRDPNRDHDHGRIYRISCTDRPLLKPKKIDGRPVAELLELLKEPEDRVRYRTRIELSSRPSNEVVAAAKSWVAQLDPKDPEFEHHRLEGFWLEQQHGVLDEALLDSLLHSSDRRVRAAAVQSLCSACRVAREPLKRLRAAAQDPDPRVRLEAVVAASFFDEPEAAQVALEILRQPTDRFLDHALQETMRTLEPVWRAALLAGRLDVADNPGAVTWLVARANDEELAHLPRTEAVLAELLLRHEASDWERLATLAELAKLRGTAPAAELLRAMRDADGRGGEFGSHARHVEQELGALLLKGAKGGVARDDLVKLADAARLPETAAYSRAACIALDGGAEASWRDAGQDTRRRVALLDALGLLPGPLADPDFERVRALVREPARAGAGARASAPPGFLVSEYETRLRTAAHEGFESLTPSATKVVDHVGVDFPDLIHSDAFALRFEAQLEIAKEGDYTFWVRSDDGSCLYVDRQLVVDNDGDHNMRERSGSCRLDAGAHSFELCFYDQGGYEGLELAWSGPGRTRGPLPADAVAAFAADPVRAAAIRLLAARPGHEAERIADAIALLRAGGFPNEALALARSVATAGWSERDAAAACDAAVAFARAIPAGQRTRADVLAALDFAEGLSARLPGDAAHAQHEEIAALRGATILIRTVPHQMLYDRRAITVAAGRPVAIVFQNDDLMPHNLVVTAPGALEEVGTAAEALALDPGAQARSFVPDLPAVLQKLRLLMPGESATLRFVAPETCGDYPYVCTFPGHWRVMNGVMHVVQDAKAAEEAEAAARSAPGVASAATQVAGSAAVERSFVEMWTVDALKSSFADGFERGRDLARGHQIFQTAGCIKCHGFRGEGVKSAPDLTEIAKKYKGVDLLRQVIEPSAVILEGYENHVFELKNGDFVIGRIVKEEPDGWRVVANLQEPDKVELVKRDSIKSLLKSRLSPMPTGLLVTFTREEILDLIAFLQSPAPQPASGTKRETGSDPPPPSH